MTYTHEDVKKIYETLRRDSDVWEGIAEHWKGRAEAATGVLQEVEWANGMCPACFAWKFGPHKDDCRLDAILNTGLPRRPEAPSDSERLGVAREEYESMRLAEEGMCQPERVYDELLTAYLKLARERVLVNALCVVSALVAFIVLAVQVYKVLGRGY